MKLLIPLILMVIGLLTACETAGGIAKDVGIADPTATTVPTPTVVPFSTISFKVGSRSNYEIPFDVQAGSTIEFEFASDLDINFRVTDPLENTLYKSDRVFRDEGRIAARSRGRYTLIFDNGFSLFTSKAVSAKYRVIPPGGR